VSIAANLKHFGRQGSERAKVSMTRFTCLGPIDRSFETWAQRGPPSIPIDLKVQWAVSGLHLLLGDSAKYYYKEICAVQLNGSQVVLNSDQFLIYGMLLGF
jgi:hypothetical protein